MWLQWAPTAIRACPRETGQTGAAPEHLLLLLPILPLRHQQRPVAGRRDSLLPSAPRRRSDSTSRAALSSEYPL